MAEKSFAHQLDGFYSGRGQEGVMGSARTERVTRCATLISCWMDDSDRDADGESHLEGKSPFSLADILSLNQELSV